MKQEDYSIKFSDSGDQIVIIDHYLPNGLVRISHPRAKELKFDLFSSEKGFFANLEDDSYIIFHHVETQSEDMVTLNMNMKFDQEMKDWKIIVSNRHQSFPELKEWVLTGIQFLKKKY